MYKSTWKDLRKLKKAQVRKRAAYTKPCRYGASCSNNGCMFYHEGSEYSSSHVVRSEERLNVCDAELTAQGQGQGASYELEQGSSSNSDHHFLKAYHQMKPGVLLLRTKEILRYSIQKDRIQKGIRKKRT